MFKHFTVLLCLLVGCCLMLQLMDVSKSVCVNDVDYTLVKNLKLFLKLCSF